MQSDEHLSVDEMKRRLQAENERIVAVCSDEIRAVLARYNCRLRVVQVLVDGQPQMPQVQIVVSEAAQ